MSGRIVIVGSGETSPTMVKIHRSLLEVTPVGDRVALDTPFGFQANADDLTEKVQAYFNDSVGTPIDFATWRRHDDPVSVRERALAMLGRASFVFAGPGSPSYALRQWADTPFAPTLIDVVRRGGTAVLGSAAAVTVGSHAIPVYEIYKVGDDPSWHTGLNLLGELTGITAAVVPHYDNKEGGRHDTRFCYLGETRIEVMEAMLPDGVGVLGVDEHTAVIIDTATGSVDVHGAGGLTLRYRGNSHVIATGESSTIEQIAQYLSGSSEPITITTPRLTATENEETQESEAELSLKGTAQSLKAAFDSAIASHDADAALGACLDLEEAIHAWSADTFQSNEIDVARQTLRAMLVDLANAAVQGLQDPRTQLEPIVNVALAVRTHARQEKDFALSDMIRDGLADAGIEVRDTPDGMEWSLT